MIDRVLIANRGEIAVRIARAARDLGIESAVLFVEPERDYRHVRNTDIAVPLVGHPSTAYLDGHQILTLAREYGCDAIHPGYGYLAENADFARRCEEADITFVGPSARTIETMADKASAREVAVRAGVPVVPGSNGTIPDVTEAVNIAEEIGYPVLIKASAGGGGKGMRVVKDAASMNELFPVAVREAEHSFGDPGVYLEAYLTDVRHIEVQVIGDHEGNVVHLGERECSIQRRYQKMLEEAPSPSTTRTQRLQLGEYALAIARLVDYRSAGTVEFVQSIATGDCYFIEMNTRVQVEHPLTELTTGIDLVAWQFRVAAGTPLAFTQDEVDHRGHAIECRITAEDPARGYLPSPGVLTAYEPPSGPGVRVDDFYVEGELVTPYFDSMIAKVITWGENRDEAIARMRRAIGEFRLSGPSSTLPTHRQILGDKTFLSGNYSTSLLDEI